MPCPANAARPPERREPRGGGLDGQHRKTEQALRAELAALRAEHRDLDAAIAALEGGPADALSLRRLKKKKLMLRDRIARIEDMLYPDIIA